MHAPLPHHTALQANAADAPDVAIDVETRSGKRDLRKCGSYNYAADASTEILGAAIAVGDRPVQLWSPGNPPPLELVIAPRIIAHNAIFEHNILHHILVPRHGWPDIPIDRFVCTMSMSLALGLPARLGAVADALELTNRKDAAGERLMHQMSRPRKPRKDEDPAGTYWFDDADRLQRLYEYCKQDVEVTRELYNRLAQDMTPTEKERAVWELSCKINQQGFHIDRPFAKSARKILKAAGPEIDAELTEITSGEVTSVSKVSRMLTWVQQQGCTATKLDRKAVERQLEKEDLPPLVRRVLELRRNGAQAAVKKIDAFLARAGDDNRVRGAFRYHGAATGRWSGEGAQPQNLKRAAIEDPDAAIAAVRTGSYEYVKSLYPQPLAIVGDCSRRMITAKPGCVFIGGDFSSVESRVLAGVAGERWKIDSYKRFDATHDPRDEPYCETACKIFGKPSGSFTKDSPERAIGKTCDLALGYQGGIKAFRKFQPDKPPDAEVEQLIRGWRAAHPATAKFWPSIDRATVLAVRERGQVVRCGRIDLKCSGMFLHLKLPSSRKISYPFPRLITDKHGKPRVLFADNAGGKFVDCRFGLGAYGGLWTENIVSGIARDLLAEAMLRLEAANYAIVLHCHDEILCEVPIGFGSVEEFTRLMTQKPAWALDLPIAASAWTGPHYSK